MGEYMIQVDSGVGFSETWLDDDDFTTKFGTRVVPFFYRGR